MKYKILILSVALIVLAGGSVCLALISVTPAKTSSLNAKREYMPTSGISKGTAVQSESKLARQTPTFPNAKREETKTVSFMGRLSDADGSTDK